MVRKDWPLMHQMLQKALRSITPDELDSLQRKWFGDNMLQDRIAITLTPKERRYIETHPLIEVGNETDYAPFDFALDGQAQGYSIDLLNLLAQRSGLKLRYHTDKNWANLLKHFKRGEITLLHSLNKTKERESIGLFSNPYQRTKTHFIIRNNQSEVTDITQLYDKTVVVGENWSTHEYLRTNHPRVRIKTVGSLEEMLEMLSSGRADAAINDEATTRYMSKMKGFDNLVVSGWFAEFDKGESQRFYFMAANNAPELIAILNKALDTLAPGELDALERKWFATEHRERVDLSAQELKYLSTKQQIRLCVDPHWMPLEEIDEQGHHNGMAGDYMALLSKKLGINLTLVHTKSWNETMEFAKARQCDLISMAKATPNRRNFLSFTTPYASFPNVVVTRSNELTVDGFDGIAHQRFAIVKGYAIISDLESRYGKLDLLEVFDIAEGLKALKNGEVYGYIDTTVAVTYFSQRKGVEGLKIAMKLPWNFDLGVATRSDEPLLGSIFQKGVDSLSEQEKKQIYDKWIAINYEKSVDYELLFKLFAFFLIILLISLYWSMRLHKAKQKTEAALNALEAAQKTLEEKNRELNHLSITDRLTQLYNRVKLDEVLASEVLRYERHQQTFGIVLIDVDYFKQVNDTYGHQVGDSVLLELSKLLRVHTRQSDVLGRWGGEEFMIICPQSTLEGIRHLAKHLRQIVALHGFEVVGHKTISVGAALFGHGDNIKSVIFRADESLYYAKGAGRNCVFIECQQEDE